MASDPFLTRPRLVYIGDPMCSWCWGFAPVLERLVARHDLDLTIVVGGLRPGPAAQAVDSELKRFLLHHWDAVASVSGQAFDRAALEARPSDWLYDTKPAGVAVVAMREIDPTKELAFFSRLQRAFYADGVDITDPVAFGPLASEVGIDPDTFNRQYALTGSGGTVAEDFAEARRLGASGFPTTLLQLEGRLRMLAAGYQPYEQVDQILHAALDRFAPDAALGATCSVGEPC